MVNRNLLNLLRRWPTAYAAMRTVYQQRQLNKPRTRVPLGFLLAGSDLMESGHFEPDETQRISELLCDCTTFINVGANIGYYVCMARHRGVKTIAIEPLEQNVQMLLRNVQANGWSDVEILPVGLGDEVSILHLYGGGTAASFVAGWAGAEASHSRLVPVTTLDNVLSERFPGEKLLILIDVEGFELSVLRGSLKQLNRHPSPIWMVEICMEEHQPVGQKINPHLAETFQMFFDHGYQAQQVGGENRRITPNDLGDFIQGRNLPSTHNFIFSKTQ